MLYAYHTYHMGAYGNCWLSRPTESEPLSVSLDPRLENQHVNGFKWGWSEKWRGASTAPHLLQILALGKGCLGRSWHIEAQAFQRDCWFCRVRATVAFPVWQASATPTLPSKPSALNCKNWFAFGCIACFPACLWFAWVLWILLLSPAYPTTLPSSLS